MGTDQAANLAHTTSSSAWKRLAIHESPSHPCRIEHLPPILSSMFDAAVRLDPEIEGRSPRPSPAAGSAVIPLTRSQMTALIERARREGVSRRDLMKIFALGGLGAVFAACERPPAPSSSSASELGAADIPWVKNPEPFIQHPTNLETRLELLDGVITPNELFFVRNHAPTPRIDVSGYRLRVEGDAIDEAVELRMDDLRALPSQSVVAYLECGVTGGASGGRWWVERRPVVSGARAESAVLSGKDPL